MSGCDCCGYDDDCYDYECTPCEDRQAMLDTWGVAGIPVHSWVIEERRRDPRWAALTSQNTGRSSGPIT